MAKNARDRAPVIVLIFLMLLSGLFMALSTGNFILNFKEMGFSSISVLEKGVFSLTSSISSTITAAKHIVDLREKYEALSNEMANYEQLQRSNAEIRQENERLKEQLDFSQSYVYKNYPANIIGRDPDVLYASLTISKGSAQGIRKNMPVIAIQSGTVGLVGRIVSVGHQTSVVMPIYNTRYNVSSRIRSTRDLGIVSGKGSPENPLIMSYVKKSAAPDLQYGDIVVTSGENGNYIRDIPVGRISRVTHVDYNATLNIDITPILDFTRLETVIVIDTNSEGGLF